MALSMDAGGGKPSSDADSDYDDSEDGGSEGSEDDGPAPQAAAEGTGVEAVASVAEPPPKASSDAAYQPASQAVKAADFGQ